MVANATGGSVEITNSGGTLNVKAAGGGVTSNTAGVAVNNAANLITVNDVITTGVGGLVTLTSTGLTERLDDHRLWRGDD